MEYLAAIPSFKLTYHRRSDLSNGLSGYCDSDWANSLSRRSTTGNLFLYSRAPISWRSKLQKTVALSTAEAEYYSASSAAIEVIYLRYLLQNMGFAPKQWTPVYEDNNACIEWGNNIVGGCERAKHIETCVLSRSDRVGKCVAAQGSRTPFASPDGEQQGGLGLALPHLLARRVGCPRLRGLWRRRP
jgi:hypothetical protein